MGTYSDQQGNLGTISNQALIDAYDREMFGTTGAELSGGGDSGNGGGYADGYGSSSYGGEAYGDNPAGTY
jgi:hypothetical protein